MATISRYSFDELPKCNLIVDAVYEGGRKGNAGDDPLSRLLKGVGNLGGFRPHGARTGKTPYVVLYTDLNQPEWPDSLDTDSGVLTYYGDNRRPGCEINKTRAGGNRMLEECFEILHSDTSQRCQIPPFFVFRGEGTGRNVIFLGLAIPGAIGFSGTEDLVAIWKSMGGKRFQNYRAKFTILDIGRISREWINSLIERKATESDYSPVVWKEWVNHNRIKPLRAQRSIKHRTVMEQLPEKDQTEDIELLTFITKHFENKPTDFEKFSCELMSLMDTNFIEYDLTRPWRDGGRDAIGKYAIGPTGDRLIINYALEAKCYNLNSRVGVIHTSRLISRIKYREFGVLVTTSCLDNQAYKEIKEDGHPILVIAGKDILEILKNNGIKTQYDLSRWMGSIE